MRNLKSKIVVIPGVFFLVCLFLMLAPNTASAQAVSEQSSSKIQMDADGDTKISLLEYRNFYDAQMVKADADGNGNLNVSEVNSALGGEANEESSKLVALMDGDKNDEVSRVEHSKYWDGEFKKKDKNADGYLTTDELSTGPHQ